MTDQLADRVADVLDRADAAGGSLLAGHGAEETEDSAIQDVLEAAAEASRILEEAQPRELLEAVGLDAPADGDEPASIPAAIARGEPDRLEDLHRLLNLAKLADRSDEGTLEGSVGDLRETIDERAGDDETTEGRDTGDGAAADEGEDGATKDEPATEGESADEPSADREDESTGDLQERLRSAMTSSLADVGDDIGKLKDRLEDAGAGSPGESDDETESDADSEREGGEATAADDEREDRDEAGDDGLLGSGLGADRDPGTSSGGATRHSTMAPPPSKRADMRAVRRFSTVPDKND